MEAKNKTTRKIGARPVKKVKEAPLIEMNQVESSRIISLIISNTTRKKKKISLFGSCYNSHDFSEFKGVKIRVPESSYTHVQRSILSNPIGVKGMKYICNKYDNWIVRRLKRSDFIKRLYDIFYKKHIRQLHNRWGFISKTINGTIDTYPIHPASYMRADQVRDNQIDMPALGRSLNALSARLKEFKFDGSRSLEFEINPKVEVLLIISYR